MSVTYYQIRYNPENKYSFSAPYKIIKHDDVNYGYDQFNVKEVVETIKLFKLKSKIPLNIWYVKIREEAYYLPDLKNGLVFL